MTDWPATLRICRRELRKGRCCLGSNMKAHGWCSVDRHADKWAECGMEPPEKKGEVVLKPDSDPIGRLTMPVEVLPPEGALQGPEVEWRPSVELGPKERQRVWGRSFTAVYCTGVAAILTAGRILIEAKADIPHGEWSAFIEFDTPISERTAQELMQIASDLNIARHAGLNPRHVAVLPQDRRLLTELCGKEAGDFDRWVDEGIIHPEMRRGDLKRHIVQAQHGGGQAEPPPLPGGQYGAILMDPPWRFETRGAGGNGRAAENHYPTMTMSRISALGEEIAARAAEDSVLFLWATSDRLADAIELMERWGFIYRSTAFVWVKEGAPGLGYWTRKGAEICLLGTRGKPKRLAANVAEVIHGPRREHSRKPDEVYVAIQALVAGPYLEVFARQAWPGWDAWGNDPALAGDDKEEAE